MAAQIPASGGSPRRSSSNQGNENSTKRYKFGNGVRKNKTTGYQLFVREMFECNGADSIISSEKLMEKIGFDWRKNVTPELKQSYNNLAAELRQQVTTLESFSPRYSER